jgi:hypothetical protein
MVDRAVEVINILKEYKEANCPPIAPPRPPKRPWEDPTDDVVIRRTAPSPPIDRVPSPATAPASPITTVPPAQEAQMGVFDVSNPVDSLFISHCVIGPTRAQVDCRG